MNRRAAFFILRKCFGNTHSSKEVGNGYHKADTFAYRRGRSFSTAIEDIIDYVENPEKTDYGKLIYGFERDTRTADA